MKSDRPASSLRERKKRQSREAILLAAQKLFVRQGYRETTVERIAASAAVAKGTFFNYFDSKEAVLRESYRKLAVRFDAKLVAISRGSDAEAAIGRFFAWAEKEFRSAGRLMDILAEEVGHDAILQKEDEEVGRQDATTFAALFRNAQMAGTVRAELDAELLGQMTVDIWSASVKRWFQERKTFSLARDLRKRVALLFDGIRPTRASAKRSPKKKSTVVLATLLAAQLLVGPAFAKERWWRGEIELGAAKKVIELRGDATVSRLKVQFPGAGAEWIEAREVKSSDKEWRATISLPDGPATIHAKEARDELRGEIQLGKISGELRATELNSKANLRLNHGVYRNASGRPIWIGSFGEFGAEHYFLDFESGRFGAIFPLKSGDVVGGPGALQPFYPSAIQLQFGDAGRVSVRLEGKTSGKFERLEARNEEEVTFGHDDIRLSGSLVSPQTKGKHAAIVLLHGSGPEDRDYLGPWVGFFSQLGLAVLSYDKRGVGKSTGDWKTARLEELADDAVSAVEMLRQRPGIDAQKIGVFGISQAGWIAPIVASRVKDLRFLLLHAGGVIPPGELGLLGIEAELRAYQFPEGEIARALAYYRLNDRVTLTGEGGEEVRAAYDQNAKAEWLLEPPQPPDSWFRRLYRGIYAFDPKPYWAEVSCPVLAFFGEKDTTVPAERNASELRAALHHNAGAKIVVLPKANHLFLDAVTGVRTEYPSLRGFVPGYFTSMRDWLRNIEVIGKD